MIACQDFDRDIFVINAALETEGIALVDAGYLEMKKRDAPTTLINREVGTLDM